MMIAPESSAAQITHAGTTYYFCCKRCAERFSADPKIFLAAPGVASMPANVTHSENVAIERERPPQTTAAPQRASQIRYTCPMHPEVIQIGPGACP
jgi:Cu+-exporting ATPase